MDRTALAYKCDRIDKAGGSVREYLRSIGFISPWGTWFRLQKEELGRKNLTEGKGVEIMRKMTLEDKKKAVEVALDGGNPVTYLKECGAANPSAAWYYIKKTLKEVDPEKHARLTARKEEPVTEEAPKMVCISAESVGAPEALSGTSVVPPRPEETVARTKEPEEIPKVKLTIKSEDLTRIDEECRKPLTYDGFKSRCIEHDEWGKFYYDAKQDILYWTDPDGSEVILSPNGWREFATEILPRAMAILGV